MEEKQDKYSFEFINKALGYKTEKKLRPEENPMDPAYVSIDPWTGDKWTGD